MVFKIPISEFIMRPLMFLFFVSVVGCSPFQIPYLNSSSDKEASVVPPSKEPVVDSSQTTINWRKQPKPANAPGFLGFLTLPFDPVSRKYLLWSNDGGIYSSHMRFYDPIANSFSEIAGSGSNQDACPHDLPNMPGDRHPDGQMAIDTKRNLLWTFGGVNQTCGGGVADVNDKTVTLKNAATAVWVFVTNESLIGQPIYIAGGYSTIVSVQDSTHLTIDKSLGSLTDVRFNVVGGTESSPRQDMYYLKLNSDSSQDTWVQVKPEHIPSPSIAYAGAMIYDPDDDVLFAFGNFGNWIYCRTEENIVPGTPTAKQMAAGCVRPDDWNQVATSGNVIGSYFPQLFYDTQTKKVLHYAGVCDSSLGLSCTQMWAYDVPKKTWTQKALNSVTPPPFINPSGTDQCASAYNSLTHKIIYHQSTNVGAPADWEYDPVTEMWAKLVTTSDGPPKGVGTCLTYDPYSNALLTWTYNNGEGEVWKGILP
jgi:hypothetical protein